MTNWRCWPLSYCTSGKKNAAGYFQYGLRRLLLAVVVTAVATKVAVYYLSSRTENEQIRFELGSPSRVEIFAGKTKIGLTNRDLDFDQLVNQGGGKAGFLSH